MGGKNHQPCNKFFGRSTEMSLALSVAGVTLEQSNIALEHMLLAEFRGQKTNVNGLVARLGEFKTYLTGIKTAIALLRDQMKVEKYVDLATIKSADIDEAGKRMAAAGMIRLPIFNRVLEMYRAGSFYSVLDTFDDVVDDIAELTDALVNKAKTCADACERGELQLELEENRPGNLRVEFARLYTAWSHFNEHFLASALVSTEAYYLANNHGSLLPASTTAPAAAATA